MAKKPRGWWTTSFRDHAQAKLMAAEIGAAIGAQAPTDIESAYRQGWADGRADLLAEQQAQRRR